MANRCTLHKSKVEAFKAWLTEHDIPHRPGKGAYELLQVLDKGAWHKLYVRDRMPEQVTVQDRLMPLVRLFLNDGAPEFLRPLPDKKPGRPFVTVGSRHAECSTDFDTPPWE